MSKTKGGKTAKGGKITNKVSVAILFSRVLSFEISQSIASLLSFPQIILIHWSQYTINCAQPVSDKIFDLSAFEKFLHDRIKVEGRTGNLGDEVDIKQVGDGKIEIVTHIAFSGRYLKYL